MSPGEYRVWVALRDLGSASAVEVAAKIGRSTAAARETLHRLEGIGWAIRCYQRKPAGRKRGLQGQEVAIWTAIGDARPPARRMICVDAVRQVLARSPVVGRAEVARLSGYSIAHVTTALRTVAIAEPHGRGWRRIYRLREDV